MGGVLQLELTVCPVKQDMSSPSSFNITELIHDWDAGEPGGLNRLVEAVYPELHRMARRYCAAERHAQTVDCTGLVHEAYLRLSQATRAPWKDRTHFFAFAARLMRGILVDRARARLTEKRGGGNQPLTLAESDAVTPASGVDILDLNWALEKLEQLDPAQARIVELRYFTGLSIEETAVAAGVSESTVKREWIVAKTWIRRRLRDRGSEP